MNSTDNPQLESDDKSEEWLARWRKQIREPGAARDRLRNLAAALDADAAGHGEDSTCSALAETLADFAAAIAHGADPAWRDPELEAHLRTCARCQFDLRALIGEPVPPAPPGGHPVLPIAPAEITPRPRLLSPGRGLVVRFNPAFIAARFQQPAAFAARGDEATASWLTLLAESLSVESDHWNIRVQAEQPARAHARLAFCITVSGDPQPALRVRLTWGDVTLSRNADPDGRANFDDLPAAVVMAPLPHVWLDIEALSD
ncbi:MAG: hypothetical protein HZB53_06085 [Chloroflexi bacterium]|nr:hypothetical protein [Chloroflexota bacterium]